MKKGKGVIIIDDEPSAQKMLAEYLSHIPEFSLLQTCSDGFEAVETINKLQPDLIFLDIEMPGKNGFRVLEELAIIPMIIFTTAHHEFALQAFEVNALDYLLKPYTRQRFLKAVEKVMALNVVPEQAIDRLLETNNIKRYAERLFAVHNKRLFNIEINSIVWIEADGDYTRIHTNNQFYISSYSMADLEKRLDPASFVRVHRSSIIAFAHIREIDHVASPGYVTMQNDTRIKISRTCVKNLKSLLSPR